jgi:hypothetical protein
MHSLFQGGQRKHNFITLFILIYSQTAGFDSQFLDVLLARPRAKNLPFKQFLKTDHGIREIGHFLFRSI